MQKPKPVFEPNYASSPTALTVMTYNVENLFDTEDDPKKQDETYLPLSKKDEAVRAACRNNNRQGFRQQECMTKDWSEEKLDRKLRRLSDVIRKVKGGRGPDILLLQEVENKAVLDKWRTEFLADLDYQPALLIDGPDERGINVGVLSRLPSESTKLHPLNFTANNELPADRISPTRGIFEATLKLPDGSLLTTLTVHLPSQSNPTEMRRQALAAIDKVKAGLPADRLIVVGGDFNISSDEEARTGLLKHGMAERWGVSHVLGCKTCPGSYFYGKDQSWSFFDVFLLSPNLVGSAPGGWKVLPESIRLENNSVYQTGRSGGPARFNENSKDGVSDHWPMAMDLIKI